MSSENVREKNKEKLIEEDVYKIRNKLGEQIGKGAFSTVYKGQADIEDSKGNSIKKGEIIALKELSGDMDKETRQNIFNEFNISNELKHNSNIVKIIDVIEINGKVYIAYEFCNGGDLRLYMDYFGNFDEGLIQTIMMQIVNGLVELFKYNVVHHDIKPENILLKLFYDTNDPIKSDKDIEKIKEILKSKKNSEIKANQFQQFFPFTNYIYNNNYMNIMNNMINMNSMMNQMFMNANNMSNINTMNMNMVPNNINTMNMNMVPNNINTMNMNMVPYMVPNNMNTMNMNNNINTMNMNNNINTMNMNMNTINNNMINMNTNNNTINNPNTFNNNLNYNNNLMNENNNNLTNIGINNNIIVNNNMNNMGINNNTNNQMYDIQKLHIPSNFRENYYQQNSNNNNQNTNFNNFVNQNNCCNNNSLINNNFSNNESIQDNNNVQQIKNKKNDTFSEGKILSILKDSTEYKLSDFGLSKIREKITKRNLCGSPLYMSPELFRPETKLSDIENKQVDIWALGVLAYELFFGKRPFEAFSIEELSKMYDRGTFEIDLESTKDKTISKQFFNFLNMCLQKDPKKRANLAKLKDSDFLNYHINSLEKMDGVKFENYLEGKEIKTPKSIFQISIEKDYSFEIKRRKSNL
jgi:serine/threonine protein kinase